MLLAVDPGKVRSYGAAFKGGKLVWANALSEAFPVGAGAELVIEKPRIWPGSGHKRPNDIVDLAWSGGAVIGWFLAHSPNGKVTEYTPDKWKGQAPKPVHHNRILKILTLDELSCLPPETTTKVAAAVEHYAKTGKIKYNWLGHNLLDAVGLGLKHLGRM